MIGIEQFFQFSFYIKIKNMAHNIKYQILQEVIIDTSKPSNWWLVGRNATQSKVGTPPPQSRVGTPVQGSPPPPPPG